ncbi:MAG TPA: 3-isopropylmalate dehydratase small subunit [Deltaproteobacteria bacterium]|nr:3-isopropylmalate dehydratase small subunit [Deltaproteobacteria bacterium]
MKIEGKVWKFGDDIDTDQILPARYLNTSDPEELAKHCMEDADPSFADNVSESDIIVAGKYFGCGSSREHAPIAIKAVGVSCVIAKNYARIFYRNSFNMGLPILECEDTDAFNTGDRLSVDMETGEIIHLDSGKSYHFKPIPPFMQELIQSGGLMKHISQKIK